MSAGINEREKVKAFLASKKLAVIATSSSTDTASESALIAFVEDEKLYLYFQTGRNTRKAKNLAENTKVSFVIGLDAKDMATLQYEGVAMQIHNGKAIAKCKRRFIDKDSPTAAEYLERPEVIFFSVTPTWISFSDYSNRDRPKVIQLSDF